MLFFVFKDHVSWLLAHSRSQIPTSYKPRNFKSQQYISKSLWLEGFKVIKSNRLNLAVDLLLPVKETNETTIKINGLNRTNSPAIPVMCNSACFIQISRWRSPRLVNQNLNKLELLPLWDLLTHGAEPAPCETALSQWLALITANLTCSITQWWSTSQITLLHHKKEKRE